MPDSSGMKLELVGCDGYPATRVTVAGCAAMYRAAQRPYHPRFESGCRTCQKGRERAGVPEVAATPSSRLTGRSRQEIYGSEGKEQTSRLYEAVCGCGATSWIRKAEFRLRRACKQCHLQAFDGEGRSRGSWHLRQSESEPLEPAATDAKMVDVGGSDDAGSRSHSSQHG